MSLTSYISCGLSSHQESDDDTDSCSHFSIMEFFQDSLCACQDTEAVEGIFRPTTDMEDPNRAGIARANKIMETPWRPPLYRDTSLLVSPCNGEEKDPSEASKTITPSVGAVSCDGSVPSQSASKNEDEVSLPPDFIPPKNNLPRARSHNAEVVSSSRQSESSGSEKNALLLSRDRSESSSSTVSSLRLEPKDVVCGRGAPTSIHPGNLEFKKIIKKYEMEYLCSTRTEKPKIAMKLLEEFQEEGVRFVKRERNQNGRFTWIEIGEQRSYEKICQSLREGAPKLRRQMMVTEAKKKKASCNTDDDKATNQENRQSPPRQRNPSFGTGFSRETGNFGDEGHPGSPSFSTTQMKNEIRYDPSTREQNHGHPEWVYPHHQYHERFSGHHFDARKYYDVPYYVHLPPHLGGERLFRDRVE